MLKFFAQSLPYGIMLSRTQGHKKLIFTGLVELVGLGWGAEKQVLLEYFSDCSIRVF